MNEKCHLFSKFLVSCSEFRIFLQKNNLMWTQHCKPILSYKKYWNLHYSVLSLPRSNFKWHHVSKAPVHATKAYREKRGRTPLILFLGTRLERVWSAFKKSAVHNWYNLLRNSQESPENECSNKEQQKRGQEFAQSLTLCVSWPNRQQTKLASCTDWFRAFGKKPYQCGGCVSFCAKFVPHVLTEDKAIPTELTEW
jgi:hypothetical protein